MSPILWPHPPTEPTPQEYDMTSPTHDELVALLTKIRDRLPEPEGVNSVEWDCASCGEAEPTWQHECTDVTEEPPVAKEDV